MNENFGDAIDNFLIIIISVAVILLLVVMLGSRQSPFRKKIAAFLTPPGKGTEKLEFNLEYYVTGERIMRRPFSKNTAAKVEPAILVQKVDERRRTMDPSGNLKLYNEYYELIFKTRKGDIIHLITSKDAYLAVPFHQTGDLQYKGERLISFRYSGGEIIDTPPRRET